jgi:hypothetical protein
MCEPELILSMVARNTALWSYFHFFYTHCPAIHWQGYSGRIDDLGRCVHLKLAGLSHDLVSKSS